MLFKHFALQGLYCREICSTFTETDGSFCTKLTDDTEVRAFLLNWNGDTSPSGGSMPLRVAPTLHALVLSGKDVALQTHYPRNKGSRLTLWPAVIMLF